MFGCLPRIGCLGVLVVGGLAYVTRDSWYPLVRDRVGGAEEVTADAAPTWQSLDQDQAARGERAVRSLASRSGPVYVNLRAGELASYAFLSLSDALPAALRDAQAAVIGDRVYVKSLVSPQDFAGALGGAFGGFLAERDTLRLGGTFDVVRPGLAQFRVREVQLGSFPVPAQVIPKLMTRVRRGSVPEGVAADALPVPIPEYIGDVRVGRGRITLYKATPAPAP